MKRFPNEWRWSKSLLALLLTAFAIALPAASLHPMPAQAERDKTHALEASAQFGGIQGTAVIRNLKTHATYIYDRARSTERFTPESSFKVPNALIGLEVKAVADEYEVKRWDGIVRPFDVWNRDHSLASAMRNSAIWYYQDMARDIGSERMQRDLDKLGYGNRDISGGIDRFWLDSSLRISAAEQADFMERLVEETLPFAEQNMKTVKRIMIDEDMDDYTVHGKTGTRLSDMGLGWYAGFVETQGATWVFATNVDSSGADARRITMNCLESMHIIDRPDDAPAL